MKPNPVSGMDLPDAQPTRVAVPSEKDGQSFDGVLQAATSEYANSNPVSQPVPQSKSPPAASEKGAGLAEPFPAAPVLLTSEPPTTAPPSGANVAQAYQQQSKAVNGHSEMSDFQKYKDDQLLRNPGGRNYYPDKNAVVENPADQKSLFGRLKKDISDSLGNVKNCLSNILLGSTIHYRGQDNQIHEARQRGLLKTGVDFIKDLGSALSFGAWHPDEKEAPHGVWKRLTYAASKLKDAVLGDLVEGMPSSVNHMGQNLVLAGWHLAEVLPDATIGNFGAGRKLTTTIFDNGHVAVEYLTDVIPSGDAWLRVHASNLSKLQPPVLYNIKIPEHYTGDTRWEYVRNTPFRKTIETIGTLLGDAAAIGLLGQTAFSSNRHHQLE